MELYGADIDGCSGEAPGVIRGSPRQGWLQIDVAASGYTLCCTDVRLRVGSHSTFLIKEGGLTRAREHRGNVRPT